MKTKIKILLATVLIVGVGAYAIYWDWRARSAVDALNAITFKVLAMGLWGLLAMGLWRNATDKPNR